MEYYGNVLCVTRQELLSGGMSCSSYDKMVQRGRVDVVRKAHGRGNYALIALDSLPDKYKTKIMEMYPEGNRTRIRAWIEKNYESDIEARKFFLSKERCGVALRSDKALEYITNAEVLNTCIKLYDRAKTAQRLFGGKYNWDDMTAVIEGLRDLYHHTLPTTTMRFRRKVNDYRKGGYEALISGKFGNQSARKVNRKMERAILSIAAMDNKPFNSTVHDCYEQFVAGELEVCDLETGELMNPDDYIKDGEPITLSESTISNYLNKPKNRLLIEKAQDSWTKFYHEQAPHVHRHAPEFSFSKISFDDRDLPRKLKDSKIRPKAYYAYDVTSQCVVGYAYNRMKTTDLVIDCFRSMFLMIERNGWCCPAQVEVENHLMSQWKDSFLKAGVVFPFVRFCAPMNSQEKYAEPMNRAKKVSIEHKNHLGIGRFYAKSRQYQTESKKVFDAANDNYVEKQYYSWDELIADDIRDIWEFNHSLHPNQKKYTGMTRWDVLVENMNPTLLPIDKEIWARYIGEKVSTSIRRNSYCRVMGEDWWLSKTEVIEKLAPNNWNVDAYCLTAEDGSVTDVWIWQNDQPIDKLEKIGTFNTAAAEQTDEDERVFVEQQKKISHFNAYVKANELPRVMLMEKAKDEANEDDERYSAEGERFSMMDEGRLSVDEYECLVVENDRRYSVEDERPERDDVEDYSAKALEDF